MGQPQWNTVERVSQTCRTPGCVYATAFTDSLVRLDVELPAPMLEDLTREEEGALVAQFHDALLPVVEALFRAKWEKVAGRQLQVGQKKMPPRWEDL